jgi:serine/threonine protein kinase
MHTSTPGRRDAVVPGTLLDGKYRLDAAIGRGSFGAVFRATHLALQKTVAVKVLTVGDPSGRFFERFRTEAEALGRLSHPNIVSVTDFGIDPRGGGVPYLVMELVEGVTLEQRCASGDLGGDAALDLLAAIAGAIDHGHHTGVLHGDIKAANVLLSRDRSGREAVTVIDFGLARLVETAGEVAGDDHEESSGQAHRPAGTVEHMAPEILRGRAPGASSDIYAFGVLAYRVLAGRYPFDGSPSSIIRKHLTETPPSPGPLGTTLEELAAPLLAALDKDPVRRPATATALVAALRSAWVAARRRIWYRTEIPTRTAVSTVAAIALTMAFALSAEHEPLRGLENRSLDWRLLGASLRAPDQRLLLVSLDDRALADDPTPLPNRGDEIGTVLDAALRAPQTVVALDLLLPETFARSAAFGRMVLTHADRLVLAAAATEAGDVIGLEAIDALTRAALGPDRAHRVFGLVNRDVDGDGVVRRGRLSYTNVSGAPQPTLAGRLARLARSGTVHETTNRFLIDSRIDASRFDRMSWSDFTQLAASDPRLANRVLLIGGEFAGSGDVHRAAGAGGRIRDISGLELAGLMVASLLAGSQPTEPGPFSGWMIAGGALVLGSFMLFLIAQSVWGAGLVATGLGAAWLVLAVAVFRGWGVAVPLVPVLGALSVGSAMALGARRMMRSFPG